MKNLLSLLLFIAPLVSIGQFSVTQDYDSVKTDWVHQDVEFHHWLKNETNDTLHLQWRLFDDFGAVPKWEDYMCKGVAICWPTTFRHATFELGPNDSLEFFHHINAWFLPGYGESTVCFFDPMDSANTVHCATVGVEAVMPDTLELEMNDGYVYVIDGDSFEIFENNYVPLGIEDEVVFDVELGQNVPNPFKDNTTISYSLDGMNGEVLIHDLTGKLIQQHILHAQTGKIQLGSDLQAGMYFYSLYNDGQHVDTKRMQVLD